MKKRRYLYVRVEFLNGHQKEYMLPKDLQRPMWFYMHENKKDWSELLKGALFNVPTSPYRKKQPKIRVARVKAQFIKSRPQKYRTRSQFIVQDNWEKVSLKKIITMRKFMRHDFSKINRLRITRDIFCWWLKSKFSK